MPSRRFQSLGNELKRMGGIGMIPDALKELAEALFHAQYQGCSSTEPNNRGYSYRPRHERIEVLAMFVQTWGSTALGFGGVGGAALTDAYTIVLHCSDTSEILVYFGGHLAYKIPYNLVDYEKLNEDILNKCLVDVRTFKMEHTYRNDRERTSTTLE